MFPLCHVSLIKSYFSPWLLSVSLHSSEHCLFSHISSHAVLSILVTSITSPVRIINPAPGAAKLCGFHGQDKLSLWKRKMSMSLSHFNISSRNSWTWMSEGLLVFLVQTYITAHRITSSVIPLSSWVSCDWKVSKINLQETIHLAMERFPHPLTFIDWMFIKCSAGSLTPTHDFHSCFLDVRKTFYSGFK